MVTGNTKNLQNKRKEIDDYPPIEDVAPLNMDVIFDDDGGGGMELSQVSGMTMTFSPDRIGDTTSAGAGAGSVEDPTAGTEDTATAASARTGNSNSVNRMLAASVGAVEDLMAGTEETAAATLVRHLVKPTGKTGNFWAFYRLYHPNHHPGFKDLSHCLLCHTDISIKRRTTTGLNKHLQHKHREQYESMNEKKAVDEPSLPSVARIFPKKPKEMNNKEMKMMYTHAVTNFIIDECQPFNIIESPEFHNLFCTFHKDADQITNVSRNRVREELFCISSVLRYCSTRQN
jgi:hypothetical protein